MDLTNYIITDHINEGYIAQEGFFKDTPHEQVKITEKTSNAYLGYFVDGKLILKVKNPEAIDAYLDLFGHTSEKFLKNGPKDIAKWTEEVKKAYAYVASAQAEFEAAVEDKNVEKQRNLFEAIKTNLPTLIATNRAFNAGNNPYAGEVVEITPAFKASLKKSMQGFFEIDKELASKTVSIYAREYASKATIKKIFNGRKYETATCRKAALYTEVKAFTNDIFYTIDHAMWK